VRHFAATAGTCIAPVNVSRFWRTGDTASRRRSRPGSTSG